MIASWKTIDWTTQKELLAWFNVSHPDAKDLARLGRLYHTGRFHAYDCANCNDHVRIANPDDWRYFQGARQDEGIGDLCGECYQLYKFLKAHI